MVKRGIILFLACFVAGCILTACAAQKDKDTDNRDNPTSQENVETESGTLQETVENWGEKTTENETSAADKEGTGKTLVIYYSATGSTAGVARMIAGAEGADIFELEPKEPYSNADLDWNDKNSRVSVEHDNPDNRRIALVSIAVPDWNSYTTVYVGYPIWWGSAAYPVETFVSITDFTGKTVIPFCTSASSGIGDSAEQLSKKAATGDWMEGKRFPSDVSEDDVLAWVNELHSKE